VDRFVAAINDADFNDAYQELSTRCQGRVSEGKFEKTYGGFFLSGGVGDSGFFGGGELRAEDVKVEGAGYRSAKVRVDWVLHLSADSPFLFGGDLFEEEVPLSVVYNTSGTAADPLNMVDETGDGDWRIDDCDPLGID